MNVYGDDPTQMILNLCEQIDKCRRTVEDSVEDIIKYPSNARKYGIDIAQNTFRHSQLVRLLHYFDNLLDADEVRELLRDSLIYVLREQDKIKAGQECDSDSVLLAYEYDFLMKALDQSKSQFGPDNIMAVIAAYDPPPSLAQVLLEPGVTEYFDSEVDQESDIY